MSKCRKTRQSRIVVTALALVCLAAAGLAGCGSTPARSVEAFCSTLDKHKQVYLGQIDVVQDRFVGLIALVGHEDELEVMWKKLAEVAPIDLQADVAAVSDAWQRRVENDVADNYGNSIETASIANGATSRVDTYVRANCDGIY